MLIIEGVDKLENEFICLKPGKTNCYILKGGNGYLLIDTGYESDYKSFLKQLKDYHIGLDEIKYLLLTHHHDDHVGFANKLLDDTDLKIISYKYSKKLLKEGKNDKSRDGGIINKRMYFVFKFGQWFIPNLFGLTFPTISLRNKDILLNGDNLSILREIGIEGDILYTPGHSIDSISVLPSFFPLSISVTIFLSNLLPFLLSYVSMSKSCNLIIFTPLYYVIIFIIVF